MGCIPYWFKIFILNGSILLFRLNITISLVRKKKKIFFQHCQIWWSQSLQMPLQGSSSISNCFFFFFNNPRPMVDNFITFDYDCKSCNRLLTIFSFYAYPFLQKKKKGFQSNFCLESKGFQPNCNNNFCYNKIKN